MKLGKIARPGVGTARRVVVMILVPNEVVLWLRNRRGCVCRLLRSLVLFSRPRVGVEGVRPWLRVGGLFLIIQWLSVW